MSADDKAYLIIYWRTRDKMAAWENQEAERKADREKRMADQEAIGLEAVLKDADFQAGLKRYLDGVSRAETQTDKAARGISGSLSSMGRGFVNLGNDVWDVAGRVGQAVGIAGAAVAGLGALVTKSALDIAGDYQSSMNVLQATTGASADQMQKLGVLAKELGADMTLPATSAADAGIAMTEMAKAGLQVNDILGASKGVLQLAAAANISNAEAAMITVNALKAFNLEGSQATMVADLLTAAATSSGSSVTEMGMAFQMGAAVANQAGVGIEDFTTMLAEMSQAGIKGSDAGTSIKTMLLRLIAPTDTAAAEMQKLGVNIYDAGGKMLPINDIMRDMNSALFGTAQVMTTVGGRTAEQDARLKSLKTTQAGLVKQYENLSAGISGAGMAEDKRRAKLAELAWEINQAGGAINNLNGIQGTATQITKKLSEEERNAALMTIFGTDAIRAASIVVGKGSEAFDTMRDKVTQSGKAADMAGARMKGFKGVLAGIKSQAETALLAFAEPMLGPLEDIGRKIADVFGRPETMAAIAQFGEMIGKNIADAIKFVSDAIAGFQAGGAGGLMTALGITPETQATIMGVFDTIMASLPAIQGALVGIGVVLAGAGIAAAIVAIANPITALIAASALLGAAWSTDWGGIRTTLTAVWTDTLQPALAELWNWLQVNIPAAIQTLAGFWTGTLQPAIAAVWDFIQSSVFPALQNLWAWLATNIPAAITTLSGFWTDTLQPALMTVWDFIQNSILPALASIWNWFAVTILPAVATFVETWLEGWGSIQDFLSEVWDVIVYPILNALWELLGTLGESVVILAGKWVEGVGKIRDFLSETWTKVLQPVLKGISDLVLWIWDKALGPLVDRWLSGWKQIGDALSSIYNNVLKPIITGIIDGVTFVIGLITDAIALMNKLGGKTNTAGITGQAQPSTPEYQTGGWVARTEQAVVHGGEFMLSRRMLAGLEAVPAEVMRRISPARFSPSSTTTNIYNQRSAEINMSPQYSTVQSPSSVYFDVSAALMSAGM